MTATEQTASVLTVQDVEAFAKRINEERLELPLFIWVGMETHAVLTEMLALDKAPSTLGRYHGRLWILATEIRACVDCPEGGFYSAPQIYPKASGNGPTGWRKL